MVQFEDTVFAPLYWGSAAAILLTGVTVVQAYVYFSHAKDGALIRWTAIFMILMDMTSSGLIAQSVYYYLIPNYGQYHQFESVTFELNFDCLISGVITFVSQLYFIRQLNAIRKTERGQVVAIWATLITAGLGFAGGIGCVATMFKFNKSVLAGAGRNITFAVFFSLAKGWAAIADIIATIAMCLWLTESKTGFIGTNSLIRELMRWIMQRGILVTTLQALLLITFWAAPQSLAWFALHMSVTKLYVNTFFAMLNGRNHLSDKRSTGMTSSMNPTRINHFGVTTAQGHDDGNGHALPLEKIDRLDRRRSYEDSAREYRSKLAMPMITRSVMVAEV